MGIAKDKAEFEAAIEKLPFLAGSADTHSECEILVHEPVEGLSRPRVLVRKRGHLYWTYATADRSPPSSVDGEA